MVPLIASSYISIDRSFFENLGQSEVNGGSIKPNRQALIVKSRLTIALDHKDPILVFTLADAIELLGLLPLLIWYYRKDADEYTT